MVKRMPNQADKMLSTSAAELARGFVFSPIRGSGLVDQTVRRLGEAIEFGLLESGERFPPESDLANMLQVSAVTLREALAVLREADYLETRRGRMGGTFVQAPQRRRARETTPNLGADEVRDLIDFREIVACGTASLACERANDEDLALLAELIEKMQHAANYLTWRRLDSRFHITIAAAAKSQRLVAAETDIQHTLSALLDPYARHKRILRVIDAQHAKILEAIARRDPSAAIAESQVHVRNTAETLMAMSLTHQ